MTKRNYGFILEVDTPEYQDDLDLRGKDVRSLGNLKTVHHIDAEDVASLRDTGALEITYGDADFVGTTNLETFKNLQRVEGSLKAHFSGLKHLGSLKYVGGDADFSNAESLENLGDLEYVGADMNLTHTKVTAFPDSLVVKGKIYMPDGNTIVNSVEGANKWFKTHTLTEMGWQRLSTLRGGKGAEHHQMAD